MKSYDAIVIGSGAGSVVACRLAEAGKTVLLLERGDWVGSAVLQTGKASNPRAPGETPYRDHLRNQRFSLYGHNAGPELIGNPRVAVDEGLAEVSTHGTADRFRGLWSPTPRKVRPHEGGYQNNAAAVGGGTAVFGAQAWRFMPEDFRMASTYGVPKGSSLADWPITYEDLEPYYSKIEQEMGVAGDRSATQRVGEVAGSAGILPAGIGVTTNLEEYPLPPVHVTPKGALLREGARQLGWRTMPVPLLINTRPYNDRPACIQCQHCVGFPCPVDAKSGTHNTYLQRALATGRCDLVTRAMVQRIDTDSAGRVVGVSYFDRAADLLQAKGEIVIVSCGAIETARLLLNSRSLAHPDGIGNHHDQVGRNLQGHYYPSAFGLMADRVYDGIGPGVSTATCEFNHGNDGVIGGGMLADDFITLPIVFWHRCWPPKVPRWGIEAKQFMRENYGRFVDVKGPVQEIPSPDSRVTIDPLVRDSKGIPVVRLSGTTHPETVRTATFMFERAREWLLASGATSVWGSPPSIHLSAGQHQAGTCRMGEDPMCSVVDKQCRVHGHDNLYVADASVHVTNGGFNPVLTLLALAYRTSTHIAANW